MKLSDDAKSVLGAWFGMGSKSILNLHLVESRPTPRCRAALDELVAAGALSKAPFNRYGGETYKPLIETREYMTWLMKKHPVGKRTPEDNFRLMEKIP